MAVTRNPNEPAPLVQEYAAGQMPVAGQRQANGGVAQQPVAAQPQRPVNVFGGGDKPSWASLGLSKSGRNERDGRNDVVGSGVANVSNANGGGAAPVFRKDEGQRDGGFFGWLGGLVKRRAGKRVGESDDEYDERMTRNNMRIATLANAIRHMGNIYNTMRGGPVQTFNSPVAMYEQGLEKRRAERQAKAAAEQDAAYKGAQLQMKQDAQNATNAYREAVLGYRKAAGERADKNMAFQQGMAQKQYDRAVKNDEFNHGLATDKFNETKRHNGVSEGQGAARIALSAERNAISRANGGGSGSGSGIGSLTNLATPNGHMNRKKDLNSIEKKQLKDYLYKNGYITSDAATAYDTAASEAERGAILNRWIGWAANAKGTAGWKFRKNLRDHYGYVETQTVSGGSTARGKAQTKGNPIRWQGSGGKQGKNASNGSKGKNTDWNKFVK